MAGRPKLYSMILSRIAPAKINLFLDILGKRPDGFHDLSTIFVALDLADRLTIKATPAQRSDSLYTVKSFVCSGPFATDLPTDENNLVVKALAVFSARIAVDMGASFDLEIELEKNVPHGAGLGGGSSDAAAAIMMANQLCNDHFGKDKLAEIAASVGSDCAFFIYGGAARGSGRGEVLSPIPTGRRIPLLLVLPDFSISTKDAYGALEAEDLGSRANARRIEQWLSGKNQETSDLTNSFEGALGVSFPELASIRKELLEAGAERALLSGSGSATFGIFKDKKTRDEAAEKLAGRYTTIPTETCG